MVADPLPVKLPYRDYKTENNNLMARNKELRELNRQLKHKVLK